MKHRLLLLPCALVCVTLAPAIADDGPIAHWTFDAGWPRLTVSGPAGTTVILRCGEKLLADGTVNCFSP